jgi:hypothetical protein
MTMILKPELLAATLETTSVNSLEKLLETLPINYEYVFDKSNPGKDWKDGMLHQVPVGFDPGNAGRIKLGNESDNRIAERVVNMLEALLELGRRMELLENPSMPPPSSPLAAVARYFHLPRLDRLPEYPEGRGRKGKIYQAGKDLAHKTRVRIKGTKTERAIIFEDEGIGQPPSRMHSTILSLGGENKIKEPYLIGMWGQGGSSALAASQLTWMVSRRAPQLKDAEDGVAWTVVREIIPTDGGRRPYYAYLAASPNGEVPSIPASVADSAGLGHGTRIGHLGFDMGTLDPYKLYQAMNHVLPVPVLPFNVYTKTDPDDEDTCWGIGYALTRRRIQQKTLLDKRFEGIAVTNKEPPQ